MHVQGYLEALLANPVESPIKEGIYKKRAHWHSKDSIRFLINTNWFHIHIHYVVIFELYPWNLINYTTCHGSLSLYLFHKSLLKLLYSFYLKSCQEKVCKSCAQWRSDWDALGRLLAPSALSTLWGRGGRPSPGEGHHMMCFCEKSIMWCAFVEHIWGLLFQCHLWFLDVSSSYIF